MTTARIELGDRVIEVEDENPRVAAGQALRMYDRINNPMLHHGEEEDNPFPLR